MKKSILIVEDEKIAAIDLQDTLIALGYQVAGIATSGERAIVMADAATPDLILMDINLSGKLSGIEAAEQILSRHEVPIIFVTAYADPELVNRAKKTKPYGYLIKPYDERAIRTEIEIALYKFGLDLAFRQEYNTIKEWLANKTGELAEANERLKMSEEKYRSILVNMQDLFFRTDTEGKITMLNPAGARLLGYEAPEDLIGRDSVSLYAEPERYREIRSALQKSGAVDGFPLTLKVRDGSLRYTLTNSHYYRDLQGQVAGVEGIIHDITSLRHAEDALRNANRKLNLMSGMTRHDIRNQLMALKAYIHLSEDSLTDPTQMAEFILAESKIANTIERQINFTRDYEDMGVESPIWQNIEALVRGAMSELPTGKISVTTRCPGLEVYADPLLAKVFYNLIDNALRYGGPAMTSICIAAQESDQGLSLVVEDDGRGIPDEDKAMIFERGFGHNTGLGLFLSREILAITGITITETSEAGKGARFEIRVPKGKFRIAGCPVP
jgi:PAS domain S-box-containing protein